MVPLLQDLPYLALALELLPTALSPAPQEPLHLPHHQDLHLPALALCVLSPAVLALLLGPKPHITKRHLMLLLPLLKECFGLSPTMTAGYLMSP